MTKAHEDLTERLARIQASLTELGSVSAATREEVLAATEQLIEHALSAHRAAIEDSQRLRIARQRERAGNNHNRKRRIAR